MRPSSCRSTPGKAILSRPDDLVAAAAAIAPIPIGHDGAPVFREPWEAQIFALTLALHERGLFAWSEWADALGTEIQRAQAAGGPDDGSASFRHWLAAIERLVAEKGIVSAEALEARRAAWDRAAHATPHGEPILLASDPLQARR